MKFLIIFAFVVLSNQCGPTNETTDKNSPSILIQEGLTITYEVQTRGFYEKVWVDESGIYFANNRELNTIRNTPISKGDWYELIALKNDLDLQTLPNLKAPSEKRISDGAAIGSLTIKTQQGVVKSSEFDHGNPPKEIKPLLNKLLSIKEKL